MAGRRLRDARRSRRSTAGRRARAPVPRSGGRHRPSRARAPLRGHDPAGAGPSAAGTRSPAGQRSGGGGGCDPARAGALMTRYLVLLRGINVGGRNKVPMAPLRAALEKLGYTNVSTYIASGNVILSSDRLA